MNLTESILPLSVEHLFDLQHLQSWWHLPLPHQILTALTLFFSVVFLIVGVLRTTEIRSVGLQVKWVRVLLFFHVVGVLCFSWTLLVTSIDFHRHAVSAIQPFFGASIATLFPVHLFVNLRRRIRLRDQLESEHNDAKTPTPR